MISLIICSLEKVFPVLLKQNIDETIGCKYELIHIYNENNKYNIFQAYNIGVAKSTSNVCCFFHDDVVFYTKNWGIIVENYFNSNPEYGIVAVAGCKVLRKVPSMWSLPEYNAFNIIQSDSKGKNKTITWSNIMSPQKVIAIDGMWFCVRSSLFEKIKFDHFNFHGFHFYDLDIAMQTIHQNYNVVVVPDIIIEHTSMGNFNNEWLKNLFIFYKKWAKSLPLSTVDIDLNSMELINNKAIITTLRYIKNLNSYALILPWLRYSVGVSGGLLKFLKVFKRI